MSENILKFIPTDPNYIPDMVAQKMARDMLMSFAPQADGVTANVTDKVQFVDQGGNFEQVSCPICGANLSMSWWSQVMNEAHQVGFSDLLVTTPCCKSACSLNDLRYDWPAGFARFVLAARNPNSDLDDGKIHTLEGILACGLRKIWAHY